MKLYKYNNYEEYILAQTNGNISKINCQWVKKEDIKMLSEYIQLKIPSVKFGLCHGTRQGNEQKWFREFLGVEVLGTEISTTATQFPNTIQWDFHDVKPEWIDNVDFIYSNSFDHSFDPHKCLDAWMSCVKKTGFLIIEWTQGHISDGGCEVDPFMCSEEELQTMIEQKYKIKEKLNIKSKRGHYFIIENK